MTLDQFINDYCLACGGNIVGMLLTGLRAYNQELFDGLPETVSFPEVCDALRNAGIVF